MKWYKPAIDIDLPLIVFEDSDRGVVTFGEVWGEKRELKYICPSKYHAYSYKLKHIEKLEIIYLMCHQCLKKERQDENHTTDTYVGLKEWKKPKCIRND